MRLQLGRPLLNSHKLGVRDDLPWREIACVRIYVANLWRADDLSFGVTRGDLVALGDVTRLDPLARYPIMVAEGTGRARVHAFGFQDVKYDQHRRRCRGSLLDHPRSLDKVPAPDLLKAREPRAAPLLVEQVYKLL